MTNGVPIRQEKIYRRKHSFWWYLFVSWDMFWNCFAGILLLGLLSLPFVIYFMRHQKQWEISVKVGFACIALIFCFLIFSMLFKGVSRMFERLRMNADEKEFAKLTRDLERDKYISLKMYFKATGRNLESANKFLSSSRGIAFLVVYRNFTQNVDNISISKIILDVEREELIISSALDVLNEY